ncbi:LOW QUALITY PROTEIN: hypothetical protein HID58_030185, partial [Brassica napus]
SYGAAQPSHSPFGDFVLSVAIPPSVSSVANPPSISTPLSVSSVSTRAPTPPWRLHPASPPSRLRPASSRSRLRPLSHPLKFQLRPPLDLPPCMSPHVPLEAHSPPKPPDPLIPFNLVLLLLFDIALLVLHLQAFSQLFSKTPDLKSPLLNLVHVFSDGVISLVYVDDTSFVSKCLSLVGCNVFLYWCVDWILRCFSIINFIYPHLPFIMLVIVFVDSTMGCSIPISIFVSLPLPLIQLISLVWYLELSFDISLFLSLVRSFTAICSPFAAVCSSIFVLNGLMPHISTHHVNWIVYCLIRDNFNTEVLIKGFVAMLKIVDCALIIRLLDIISYLTVLYAPIFLSFYVVFASFCLFSMDDFDFLYVHFSIDGKNRYCLVIDVPMDPKSRLVKTRPGKS